MAGGVVISDNNVWTLGSHFYHPIMEMMRSEYLAAGYPQDEIDAQFAPLEQGFECISIDDLISYHRFVSTCNNLLMAIDDGSIATELNKAILKDCLEDILAQLKADAKYSTTEA